MAKKQLINKIKQEIRLQQLNVKTENAYISWIKRFIVFHNKHPKDLGRDDIRTFITHLTQKKRISASTQSQILDALMFLYKISSNWSPEKKDLPKPPVVFTHEEAMAVISQLHGAFWLIAYLMYGSGLRARECLSIRVKDINFNSRQIRVRGYGSCKERVTVFPSVLSDPLRLQLEAVKTWFERDMKIGLQIKDDHAANDPFWEEHYDWQDQYVFPNFKPLNEKQDSFILRSHIGEHRLNQIVKQAIINAGITKPAGCNTFRHSFASEILKRGNDIRFLQKILGHNRISTTMIYSQLEPTLETA